MEFTKEMWEKYGYVISSTYRQKVMKSLENEKTPSQIAKDAEIKLNHISKTLGELREQKLIECTNPEVRKGKLYKLTDKGKEIVEKLG